ncbi:hypothetical protein SAMN05444008_114113 [Cnuella takakiae]|uniref:Uncharacterized protein n=1 Tax=Cnuella takakiae TaxID=1302690 RepID=A0A1M5FRI2_9BACT|nr:hypothetical protein [Cnuella takakiae]OLY93673.1 hypothetical protein BUE76_18645 [Cnuella takakiae]SHF93761.1 hypothetical protein SAMN05444008_114113 [Cnuella takakiae]
MEQDKDKMIPDDNSQNRGDLEPGRGDRNLLSNTRDEAPIDQDSVQTSGSYSSDGDETYEDEDMDDPDYYEKRAGDDVRK